MMNAVPAEQHNANRQLRRIPEPKIEIQAFPVDGGMQPSVVPTQPVVAPHMLRVVQTTNPNAGHQGNRPRRSSIVLTVPPSNVLPRSRRASIALSVSSAGSDVPIVEVPVVNAPGGSPEPLRAQSPRIVFPVSAEVGPEKKAHAVVVTQVNRGIDMPPIVATAALPAKQPQPVVAPQNSRKAPATGGNSTARPSGKESPQGVNATAAKRKSADKQDEQEVEEVPEELGLELDGLNLPNEEAQLQPWLTKMRRRWREGRGGRTARGCGRKAGGHDRPSDSVVQPYVAVAKQLGFINRTRRAEDWCGGSTTVRGNVWVSRKYAKMPENESALERHVQQLQEWYPSSSEHWGVRAALQGRGYAGYEL